MLDKDFRYSLCISYSRKVGPILAYRIADFNLETRCFEEAKYTKKDDMDYEGGFNPVVIGANPDELDIYKAEIRKWIPKDDDYKKQWSYTFDFLGKIYEIVKPQEFNEINVLTDEEIRKVLQRGISINKVIDEEFLMIIDSIEDEYIVIKCKKSDFVEDINTNTYYILRDVKDIFSTKHYFFKYKIKKQDIVSTQLLSEELNKNNTQDIRYFYKKTELNNAFEKFYVRNPECYINIFYTWYFKYQKDKSNLTRNEIKKLLDIIKQIKDNEKEINNFFSSTGITYDFIKKSIEKDSHDIISVFLEKSQLSNMIEKCLFNNEDIYNESIEIAKKHWLNENDKIKEQMEDKLNNIIIKIEEYGDKFEKIKSEIKKHEEIFSQVQGEIENAERMVLDLENRKQEIEIKINQHIERFKKDIIYATELIGVSEAIKNKEKLVLKDNYTNTYIRHAEKIQCGEVNKIRNIKDFCEELSDNIYKNFKNDMNISATLVAALLNNKAIILSDSIGEIIANDVSALVDSSSADYIFISGIQEDIPRIINLINKSETKTIYIDGILNTFNESAFVAICKNCKEKHLFFGVGTKDIVSSLSKNIWNYSIYLEAEKYMCLPRKGMLRIGNNNLSEINTLTKENNINYYNKMSPFVEQGLITNKIAIDYTYLLSNYHQIIRKDKLEFPLLYSLHLCSKNNILEIEDYENKLKACKISENDIEILRDY